MKITREREIHWNTHWLLSTGDTRYKATIYWNNKLYNGLQTLIIRIRSIRAAVSYGPNIYSTYYFIADIK